MAADRDRNWRAVRLGALFELDSSGCIPARSPSESFEHYSIPAWDETGGPVVERGSAIESNKILLTRRCILVSKLNPRISRVIIFRPRTDGVRTCASTELMAYVPVDDSVLLEYYAHFMRSTAFQRRLESCATGTTNSHVRLRPQETLKWMVPAPPIGEQRQIARILDVADDMIERTREANAKARRLMQGVVHALLKNGIDGAGRARDRNRNPADFQSTKAGWLPADWHMSTVGAEFEIGTGFVLNELRRPRVNKIQYLRVANVQRQRVVLDDIAELEATVEEAAGRLLRQGDLLVVEGHADPNAIGRCASVPKTAEGMTFQNHLYRLRAHDIIPDFACLWLNSEWARRYWRRMCATSSGLNTINQRMLKALIIPKPAQEEQRRITQIAGMLQDQIDKREEWLKRAPSPQARSYARPADWPRARQ